MTMYFPVAYLKFTSKIGWSIQEMMQLLQLSVFKRPDLGFVFKLPDNFSNIEGSYTIFSRLG